MLYKSLQAVKEKILDYKNNIIDRDALSSWAYDALMGILQDEEIVSINNLVAYPFLSALSIKSNSLEKCSDDEILSFLDIISGDQTNHFSFFIKIPQSIFSDDISKIIDLVNSYTQESCFSEYNLDIIEELTIDYETRSIETINELLIVDALKLISYLPRDLKKSGNQDSEIEVDGINIEDKGLKYSFIKRKIFSIIETFAGEQCLYISVHYQNNNVLVSMT